MTTKNIPLIKKIVEHIEAHPEQHDQSNWGSLTECGTSACVAGWAILLSGHPHQWSPGGTLQIPDSEGKCYQGYARENWIRTGAQLLGLPYYSVEDYDEFDDAEDIDDPAYVLFYYSSDEEAVDTLKQWIAEAEGEQK